MSKSDPMVILYSEEPNKGWKEVGRTEVIK